MELASLIKEFYNIHQKIKISIIIVNQKLTIETAKEIKKSLQYALLTINNMDTNIHKRNLKIMPKEDLQKKAQMAEEENNTLILDKKTNVNK